MGASRPQTTRGFLVLDYFILIYQKLQFYVELAFAEPRSRYTSEKYHTFRWQTQHLYQEGEIEGIAYRY